MSVESTTERLLADNYSNEAAAKIEEWRQARDAGKLFVIGACSDARLILPEMAYHIRTISATGPRSPWHGAFNYDKVQGILIIDHFDCGGLKVKEAIAGQEVDDGGAMGFVRDHVWHKDPIHQSILTASWTASRTHKPVLAVVQDHHDGSLYVQGCFNDADQTEYKTIPTYLLVSKYIEEDIYKDGRPQLKPRLIAPVLKPCLAEISERANSLVARHVDLRETQSVQNMEFVGLSNNLKPLSVRFPGLFGEPNTIFQVSLRRQSLDETESGTKDVNDAFTQIHYPISHCVENQGKPNAPFQDTRVLYIETEMMDLSAKLAKHAMRRHWIREWMELPDREIIIAEVVSGRIQKLDRVA